MRAMVLHRQGPIGPGRLQPEDRPDPDPGPREIRVRVRAAAICRTDLHVIEGDLPPQRANLHGVLQRGRGRPEAGLEQVLLGLLQTVGEFPHAGVLVIECFIFLRHKSFF